MAISWGSYDDHLRVGIEIHQSPSSVSNSTSSVSLDVNYYIATDGWDWSDTQTLTCSGSASGSFTFSNTLNSGSAYVGDLSATVSTSYSGSVSRTFSAKISGAYNNARPSKSLTHTVGKRPYDRPSSPGRPSVSSSSTSIYASWGDPSDWGGNNTSDFKLEVSINSNFTGVTQYVVTNSNSRTVTGLSPNRTYYLRVRAYNAAGNGSYSSVRSVKTDDVGPNKMGTPKILGTSSTTVGIDWVSPGSDGSAINACWLQVDNNSNFASTVFSDSNAGGSETVTGLARNTVYYCRTRARNDAGWGNWSNAKSFRTDAELPSKAGTPTASGVGVTTASLSWDAPSDDGGANIKTYDLQISPNSNFSGAVTYTGNTDRSQAISGLERNTTYYARVRAGNSEGKGSYSNTRSFTTDAELPSKPGRPTVTNVGVNTANLAWGAPSDSGGATITAYYLQVSLSPDFTSPLTYSGNTDRTQKLTGLVPGKHYYSRVRAVNSAGNGPYSYTREFDTLSGGSVISTGGTPKTAVFKVWDGSSFKQGTSQVYTASGFKPGF